MIKLMGVDFYACNYCGETFDDVGYFVYCGCGNKWCSDECAKREGFVRGCSQGNERSRECACDCDGCTCEYDCKCGCYHCNSEGSCGFCRKEAATDSELLVYALNELGIMRDVLIELYLIGEGALRDMI